MSGIRKHILALLLLPAFWGCISDVTINTGNEDRELVLNCILNASSDTVFLQLSYSKPIESEAAFEPVKDAQIKFFENGERIGEMVWVDSSIYILPFRITAGRTYRLEAAAGNNNVWAETTVPLPVEALIEKVEPGSHSKDFRIFLNDNATEDNLYWVTATGYEGIEGSETKNIACLLYSNFEYADDFNQSIYQNGRYKFEYEYYLRFTDSGLPGGKTEIVFYPQCINNPIEVYLLSTDYHLDKYMKSSLLLRNMDLLAREMPIVYAPFPMYSNINGGTGILGSYNSVSKLFNGE